MTWVSSFPATSRQTTHLNFIVFPIVSHMLGLSNTSFLIWPLLLPPLHVCTGECCMINQDTQWSPGLNTGCFLDPTINSNNALSASVWTEVLEFTFAETVLQARVQVLYTHIFSTLWSSSFERGHLWAYKPDLLIGCANVHGVSKQMLKYTLSHEPVFFNLKTFCSLGVAGPCLPQRLGGLRLVPSQLPFDQPILCFFSPVRHPAFNLKSSCLSHRRC